jgi:hypothetical protein
VSKLLARTRSQTLMAGRYWLLAVAGLALACGGGKPGSDQTATDTAGDVGAKLWCWGSNSSARAGSGGPWSEAPVAIQGLPGP